MKSKLWLVFAIITTVFWGIWGAFTGLPAENGFPETLIYCVGNNNGSPSTHSIKNGRLEITNQ